MDIDDSLALNDSRVIQASREYLAELDAGRDPDREPYFERDPDLREVLSEVFDGIDLAAALQPKPVVPTETIAEPLGDFRILRQLGRGGMGVVYEAVQLSLGRHVALKVLPFAASMDARTRHRFQVEAQAAALLHHTNIVPVYAVGCERGLHFYAMQLIEGGSLAEFISAQKELNPRSEQESARSSTAQGSLQPTSHAPGSKFSNPPRERRTMVRNMVELTAKVADALDYAHRSGTIHRDIKPANLMLDHGGNVWITDFGLAHVATDVSLTATGDIVGTMRYMSPEQAGGKGAVLDGRTDIYSLGATLYELLTLHPIFESTSRHELLGQILLAEPKPLRQWDRTIPVEVETIILKCLSKNPAERYSSAGELAEDLRRFLQERPILARRPTPIDYAKKWLRRHPSFVIASAIVLIAGIVGMGITTGIVTQQQKLTQHQQKLTHQALIRESQRAREAEERFKMALRAAETMKSIAENDLDGPPQESARRRLLDGALHLYQQFTDMKHESPDEKVLADTRDEIAKILKDLEAMEVNRQLTLLEESDVLKDLGVTDDQEDRLEKLIDSAKPLRRGGRRGGIEGPEAINVKAAVARDNANALSEVLTQAQSDRLKQLVLQWEGPRVFFSPKVSDSIKLTVDQRKAIRKIEHRWLQSHGFFGKHNHKPKRPDGESIPAVIKEIVEVLTPEQQQIWRNLIGRPYEGEIGDPFWGGGGGGPQGPER